jgi:hypothetical protein
MFDIYWWTIVLLIVQLLVTWAEIHLALQAFLAEFFTGKSPFKQTKIAGEIHQSLNSTILVLMVLPQ